MTADNWVSLITHIVWPSAVVALAFVLRSQVGDFLVALGARITKLSVMSVSIELAAATEATPPWRGAGGEDIRGLVGAQLVNDSYFDTLRQSLAAPGTADYFVVDLKRDGSHEWLTSRLYLFAYLLGNTKGVRAVVFTATRGDVGRSVLGVASAPDLLRTLGNSEPWLRAARLRAEAALVGQLPPVVSEPPSDLPLASETVPPDINDWWLAVLP